MGLVLDSSVLIDAERRAMPILDVMSMIDAHCGETRLALSAIAVMELEHGWHRALDPGTASRRRVYLDELFAVIPSYDFTDAMARTAARLDAETKRKGIVVPLADLMIGVTAIYLGQSVGTRNPRHFRMIPSLDVVEF